jgi:uncharacterized protein YndB with AHSA1/START domain
MSSDRIEKQISLRAPRSVVWRALTDYQQFGEWFRVRLETPFTAGQESRGNITYPGYEHLRFIAYVDRIEPESYFAFRWHPYPADPDHDYTVETPTLVEFTLADEGEGTLLKVVESGFDQIPAGRRDEAFRMNSRGWEGQMGNIQRYVEAQ